MWSIEDVVKSPYDYLNFFLGAHNALTQLDFGLDKVTTRVRDIYIEHGPLV
jgi:hypothetical protein